MRVSFHRYSVASFDMIKQMKEEEEKKKMFVTRNK